MSSRRDRGQSQGTRSLHCRGYDTVRIGEKELRDVFSQFGRVIDVYLPKDYFTKKVRGFAYIQFEDEAEADAARLKLDRTDIFSDGRHVNIMWAAGDRKTPTDMRRLDIERDNPHARRALQRTYGRDWQREWERDRERLRRERGFRNRPDRFNDRPPQRRDSDNYRSRPRSRSRSPPDRSRAFGYGGARPLSRSRSRSPSSRHRYHDRDRRPYDDDPRPRYDRFEDRDRDRDRRDPDLRDDHYGRKRARSPSPAFDRRPPDDDYHPRHKRRRTPSRSPPPLRRRSVSPPPRHLLPSDHPQRPRLSPRSRTPSPPRDRSPHDRNGAPASSSHAPWDRNSDAPNGDIGQESPRPADDNAPKLRSSVAPKLRSAPLSPVETTPPSPESR